MEDNTPINLSELRISMPQLPNEYDESFGFFETLMKENYGEHKFKRAL
jgi:hypothetical protein